MPNESSKDILNRIASATVCEPEQVREVVRLAFETLHKIAFCDEKNVTAALVECYYTFGEGPCYHLSGILEEARIGTDSELPWSEFLARFSPQSWPQFGPIREQWAKNKTEDRKALDGNT
jgi:hypothetical protein